MKQIRCYLLTIHSSSSESSNVFFSPAPSTMHPVFLALASDVALPLPFLPFPLLLPSLPSLPLPLPSPDIFTLRYRPSISDSLNFNAFSHASLSLNSMKAMPRGFPSSLRGILKLAISPHSANFSLSASSVVEKGKPPTKTSNSLLPLPSFPLPLALPSPFAGGGSPDLRTLSVRPP